MIKKINFLKSKTLVLTIKEPDWRKMFEVYLNIDIMKQFVSEEEINANRKAIQKKLTLAREQPKKYHLIYDKPPLATFYYFIRGLYFEYGVGLTRPDPIKAYEIFLQGFEENQDPLCAYKIAAVQSDPKNKCKVKVDKQKAMFFLVMASILMDLQYQGNMCDIRSDMTRVIETYEEGLKLSDILIQKFGGAYYSNEMKAIYSLMFDYQYCHPSHLQEKYNGLILLLESQIKTFGDQFCLIHLYQILIQNNQHAQNHNKNIKSIIDISISAKKESFKSALNLLLTDFTLASKGVRDSVFFQNGRQIFYEMYNFIKFFGGPDKSELLTQVFAVNEFLYEKQFFMVKHSLHYSLTMRIRSEMFEKGLGVVMSLQQALESINKELVMPKDNENNYAYANYVAGKLKRKLNYPEQQVIDHFQKSYNQFLSRLNSDTKPNSINKLVYLYYLARLSKIWRQNFLDTQNRYREALNLYLRERRVYKNSQTLQLEILCIKIEKKTNSQGQASIYYGHGIVSPQNTMQLGGAAASPNQQSQQVFNYSNPQMGQSNINQNPTQSIPNSLNQSRINGQENQNGIGSFQNSANPVNQSNFPQNSQLQNSQINQNRGNSIINSNSGLPNNNQTSNANNQMNQSAFNPQNQNINGSLHNLNNQNQGNIFTQNSNQPNNNNMGAQSIINQSGNNPNNGMTNSRLQQNQSNNQQTGGTPNNQSIFQQQNNPTSSQINNQISLGGGQQSGMMSNPHNKMNASQLNDNQFQSPNNQQNNLNQSQIAHQLVGTNNTQQNMNTQMNDRQNYFDTLPQNQGDMNYTSNRPNNQNQSVSPNQNNSNLKKSNFQPPNNTQFTQQNLQTHPNAIDVVGLNKSDNRGAQNGQNISMNSSPQNAIFGNSVSPNHQSRFANQQFVNQGSNNTLDLQSPYGPQQGNQSIYGNSNPQSKFLNSGFQNVNVDKTLLDKLNQLKSKRTFYDPQDVITMDFLHRGSNYITSEAVIINRNAQPNTNLINQQNALKLKNQDMNIISADKLSKFRSYKKHMNVSSDDQQILDGEPVVVKQFVISNPREIDEMFNFIETQEKKLLNQSNQINNQSNNVNSIAYQQHLAQVFLSQNLIYIKGFSYQPISNDAVALYLFYPAQSYNLYGAMKKNFFSLQDKLLVASQICDCVYNLHASSIFHLNLKPSNILFDNKRHPYISGWEIKRKENLPVAEENIDDEAQDEKNQFNFGYTAPEVVNSVTNKPPTSNQTNTPNKSIGQVNSYPTSGNFSTQPQFGPGTVNTYQPISQFGPRSDVWSLGMILHFLFFRIDSGEGNFCRDKRIYQGFNLIITEYAIGSNYFLDKIKELIEEMVKSNPDQRATLSHVKDIFQKLYIELDSQIKQDLSPNRSYNSSMITQNTANNSNFNSISNVGYQNYNSNHYLNNQTNSLYSNNNYNNNSNNAMFGTPQTQLGRQQSGNTKSYYSPNKYDTMNQQDPFYSNSSQKQNRNVGDPLGLSNMYQDSVNNNPAASQLRSQQHPSFMNQKSNTGPFYN